MKLLTASAGGGAITLPSFPTSWGITRFAGNPVIDVDNNPNETNEQYVPAPIRLPNEDIWVYVKGLNSVYAWLSTDAGETFALQNSSNPVIAPMTGWESEFALEPVATYDPVADLIHLYYKGTNDSGGDSSWGWGHATAPGSTPTVFTRDNANPILTSATVSTALGGGAVLDMAISDVVKIGSTFHFYGYAHEGGTYQLIQATGSDWNNPSGVTSIQNPPGGMTVIQSPSVFLVHGIYAMLYSVGGAQPNPRWIRVAQSLDAVTWDFSDTINIISPQGTDWEEDETYTCSVLKEGTGPVPILVNDQMLLYYSGLETPPADANIGLIYMDPN